MASVIKSFIAPGPNYSIHRLREPERYISQEIEVGIHSTLFKDYKCCDLCISYNIFRQKTTLSKTQRYKPYLLTHRKRWSNWSKICMDRFLIQKPVM
jgi:hypothetical protein